MLHISKYQKIYTGNQAAKMSKTKSKKKNYLYTNQQFIPLNKLRLIFPYLRSLQQLKLKSDKIMTLQSWPTPSYFRPWTICLCLRLVSPSKLLVSRWQIPRGSLEWSSRMSAGMISSQARWTKSPAWTSIHSLFTYLPSALQDNNRDMNVLLQIHVPTKLTKQLSAFMQFVFIIIIQTQNQHDQYLNVW